MLAVRGFYNGTSIALYDDVDFYEGQEVIITLLNTHMDKTAGARIDFAKYTMKIEREQDPQDYISELRENDRI